MMKRFLSWIVAAVGEYIVLILIELGVRLVGMVFSELHRLSPILYYAALFFGGLTVLGILIGIVFYGSGIAVALSEKIFPSSRGMRYIVIGLLWVFWFGFILIGYAVGYVRGGSIAENIASLIAAIVYVIFGYFATQRE